MAVRACLALTNRRGTGIRTGRLCPPKGGRALSCCARGCAERPAPRRAKIWDVLISRLNLTKMLRVKHFGKIDGLGKRTFAARGMVQSRDLARTEDCDEVHAGVFPDEPSSRHIERRTRKSFCVQHANRIVHQCINVLPLFSLTSILPENRKRLKKYDESAGFDSRN